MTGTWAGRGIACIVMAGLMAGCMRPAGPSGLVRSGQTGRYVALEAARPSCDEAIGCSPRPTWGKLMAAKQSLSPTRRPG